ncbi:hypothetical protein O6H91_11G117400 [Diphasiastrum complanatum]|uniref:Uncharacterized protein n=1 Tax=Diphasiastrum complanatum TaxID=34168 RepID=A0ACC2CDI0_DIPCM|nr:hypothetical protein O6H91_11G117400 [Diphasiastrum complanatum]
MAQISSEEISKYGHSPVHMAVVCGDHSSLRRILAGLPRLAKAGEVRTEAESIRAEQQADAVSAVIDRRDVPGRETPLHLAVRLGDAVAAEMLMSKGCDWSLQNERGWSPLQEAVCAREEAIAMIITRHYQPLAWAKWCRRLPRIISTVSRMRDFYMELTFHFESSVIPFIGRIAPSDTYRIWKRGGNLRADMTLAGFDGFRIQRSDQSFLFLGEGTEDGKLSPGSLCVLSHKTKEVMNALEGAGSQLSEAEIAQEVAAMAQTNMYRPGIDVTQAELVANLNWRRQERTEMVGQWKSKVYEMHHVTVSVRSRRVPGAMTDEELFGTEGDKQEEDEEDYGDLLTEEERQQLESALKLEGVDFSDDEVDGRLQESNGSMDDSVGENGEESLSTVSGKQEIGASGKGDKKGWFSLGRKSVKQDGGKKLAPSRNSVSVEERGRDKSFENGISKVDFARKSSKQTDPSRMSVDRRYSDFKAEESLALRKGKEKATKKGASKEATRKPRASGSEGDSESEYKKGLRPVLWLTQDFPLKTEELLPLLDILANKVKAVRRLRELLTTKLPPKTFPVKVAIPVVPTIRVVVTFTKFEDLHPLEEFGTPLSSPQHFEDDKLKEPEIPQQQSNSWFSWIKGAHNQGASTSTALEDHLDEEADPFLIPPDYVWVDMNEKKRRTREKKAKSKKGKKYSSKLESLESDDL